MSTSSSSSKKKKLSKKISLDDDVIIKVKILPSYVIVFSVSSYFRIMKMPHCASTV